VESTINERLKVLLDALGTNPNALAKILGVGQSTVRNYLDRESKPGYEVLEKLYHSFEGINLPWLFGSPGEPLLPNAAEAPDSVSSTKKISRSMIVGNVAGNATQNHGISANEAAMQRELELLRAQLADKERTIQILLSLQPKP
jgi:transcriptional regulator with XRE-family HTH domain